MQNLEIRNAIKEAGLKLWEIADKLGMNDGNFSRKLRKELTDSEKEKIFSIIEELRGGNKNEGNRNNIHKH